MMISVDEARQRILAGFTALPAEQINIADALGRVLARDIASRRTQPPTAVSAMDGYAVRAADTATPPVTLKIIGQAPAGGAHDGAVGRGECVRIFTGGPVPDGADAIVIQEDTDADGDRVTVKVSVPEGHYIRPAGLDFSAGEICLKAGRIVGARDVGLAAAMNVPWMMVHRRPRVAILATGDEVVMPGDPVGPNQIVSSNSLSLGAFVQARGGIPVQLGIAPDNRDALAAMAAGDYPEGVPERYRISPESFESEERFPKFPNTAMSAGLNTMSLSGGSIAEDLNGDGFLDIVVSSWGPGDQLRVFMNGADGTFYEATEQAGLLGLFGGLNLNQADYDNDGDVDIFVMRGLRRRACTPIPCYKMMARGILWMLPSTRAWAARAIQRRRRRGPIMTMTGIWISSWAMRNTRPSCIGTTAMERLRMWRPRRAYKWSGLPG